MERGFNKFKGVGIMPKDYVHGYSQNEACRLSDQANTLEELLHHDTVYPDGHRVLEAGCGTGAQTEILIRRCPGAVITAIDQSAESLQSAHKRLQDFGCAAVTFEKGDLYHLPYQDASFDHVLVCFVLEHLKRPLAVLEELKRVLVPGGSITAIEGDHGSFYCHPETPEARQVVQCLIDIQAHMGGDALIGRRLFGLLRQAGFHAAHVSPRVVYVDESRPDWEEGFSRNTFIAMVEGVASQAIDQGLISDAAWEKGISDLNAATGPGSSFHYSFFKGTGLAPLEGG